VCILFSEMYFLDTRLLSTATRPFECAFKRKQLEFQVASSASQTTLTPSSQGTEFRLLQQGKHWNCFASFRRGSSLHKGRRRLDSRLEERQRCAETCDIKHRNGNKQQSEIWPRDKTITARQRGDGRPTKSRLYPMGGRKEHKTLRTFRMYSCLLTVYLSNNDSNANNIQRGLIRWFVNNELERVRKEVVVTWFKAHISHNLPGEAEEKQEKTRSAYPIPGTRFESGTSKIWRNGNHTAPTIE
jgi:hypothetical protein